MGSVLGKTETQESGLSPSYEVLGGGQKYEIRAYSGYVVAEVQTSEDENATNECFRTLAKYIGVFGDPANKHANGDSSEKISMTTPVVVGPSTMEGGTKVKLTAPVVQQTGPASALTMQFIMPQKYKKISDLPTPTDGKVCLREVPEHIYLVHQFSGNLGSDAHSGAERERVVTEEAMKKEGGAFVKYVTSDSKFLLARYNPPWTLPFLKTNELWFPLPLSREEIKAKLEPST